MVTYFHVDVFANRSFTGNSLTVFMDSGDLEPEQMLAVTQEMRHFESIFLSTTSVEKVVEARVFDLFEELPFAGHPLIGAGAVLHHLSGDTTDCAWTFKLPSRSVTLKSQKTDTGFCCVLDQGRPEFIGQLEEESVKEVCRHLNLDRSDIAEGLPLEVISTGLKYLIVPVKNVLAKASIISEDFEILLASFGAQFAYVLDVEALEGRHWNNDGLQEDVATGSAAGTVGAYMAKHGRCPVNEEFILSQGRFLGRPSEIRVRPEGSRQDLTRILVGGDVALVASGSLLSVPEGPGQ